MLYVLAAHRSRSLSNRSSTKYSSFLLSDLSFLSRQSPQHKVLGLLSEALAPELLFVILVRDPIVSDYLLCIIQELSAKLPEILKSLLHSTSPLSASDISPHKVATKEGLELDSNLDL